MTTCPECDGEGKRLAMFPRYASHVPPEDRKPVIEMTCSFCEGLGAVTEQRMEWRRRGHAMREERKSRMMTLRAESDRRCISPLVLSNMERGIVEPIEDRPHDT